MFGKRTVWMDIEYVEKIADRFNSSGKIFEINKEREIRVKINH